MAHSNPDIGVLHGGKATQRVSKFDFYNVEEFNDGTLVLSPRVLVDPIED